MTQVTNITFHRSTSAHVMNVPAPNAWPSFTATDGRTLLVSCDHQRLITLRGPASVGMRLKRRVTEIGSDAVLTPRQLGRLSREDVTHIDFLVIAHGLALITELKAKAPATLIVPVSYLSLTSRNGRDEVVSAYRELAMAGRYRLIAEIREIDGVPAHVVAAAAALIEPASSAVLGHLCRESGAGLDLQAAELDGLTFECRSAGAMVSAQTGAPVVEGLHPPGRMVVALDANDTHDLALAMSLGATHAGLAA